MSDADERNLQCQRDKLIEIIEPEFGLLHMLLKARALTRGQLEQIQSQMTKAKKNEMILDHIFQTGKYQSLITALTDSCQTHVVNWIKRNGDYADEFRLDWPLTDRENEILDYNQEALIDLLDTDELLSRLYSVQAINNRQRDVVSSKPTDHEKNEVLLGIIRRFSRKSYLALLNCLRESGQDHVADILENGGAVVRLHATPTSDNLDKTEAEIVNEITNLLMKRKVSAETANLLLARKRLSMLNIVGGQEDEKHVFISYQRDSQAMTLKLANSLKEAGYKVWIDEEDKRGSLVDGKSEAVEKAAVVLICLSQKYKDSKYCRDEAEYAYRKRKDIVPLLMQSNYEPDEWLELIIGRKIQYDFTCEKKYEESLKSLIEALGEKGKPVKDEGENERIRRKVKSMYDYITSEVDPRNVMDEVLLQEGIISIDLKDEVMKKVTNKDRCQALLDLLISSSHEKSFIILREALKKHYPWIVERIDASETNDEYEDSDVDYQHIKRQREKLIEIIEPEFGLLDKLLKARDVTRGQLEQIQSQMTKAKKNEMILDYIFKDKKHQNLITALAESCQTHVVNWIKGDGEYEDEFGLDWPLTKRETKVLNDNQEEVVDLLDTLELLPMLYSEQVINRRQREFIDLQPFSSKRNEELLEIVRRFSRKSYLTLMNCLRESNQAHIAEILENGGVIVRVHATLEGDNLDETEARIVHEMSNLLMNGDFSLEQAAHVLAAIQLNIIAVKRGGSIVVYIYCNKEEEFARLCETIENLKLQVGLEQLLNSLNNDLEIKVNNVTVTKKDIEKAKQSLKGLGVGEHVFISYQWDSQPITLKLKDWLNQAGYKVWIDVDDMRKCLVDGMSEAVEKAAVVLICFSQKYMNSTNCQAEAKYAFTLKKEIIPLRMESDYKPNGWLGLIIGSKLYHDFSCEKKYEESLKSLIKALGNSGKTVNDDAANQISVHQTFSCRNEEDMIVDDYTGQQ